MKNWVIANDKEFVQKVGEFFIQSTTVEYQIGLIFNKYKSNKKEIEKFAHRTFGDKLSILKKLLNLGELEKRLSDLKNIRNRLAHDVVWFDPTKEQHVLNTVLSLDIDAENNKLSELITDLSILTAALEKANFRNALVLSKKPEDNL